MKITSINEKESGECWLALETEPKLTAVVFKQYETLCVLDPILNKFKTDYRDEKSLLILSSEKQIDSFFSKEIIEQLQRVLTSAEALVAQDVARRAEQEKLKKRQRKDKIEAAANKLGLPLK